MQNLTIEFIFSFFLVFTRFASMIYLMPGMGDEKINIRIKLVIAIFTTLVTLPLVSTNLPSYTVQNSLISYYLISEMLVGSLIGLMCRIISTSILILGNLVSMLSGLSVATIFDHTQREQIMLFSSFVMTMTIAIIFASDTHHIFIAGFIESYKKFTPGEMLDLADSANIISRIVSDTFILSFKISSPFLIVGIAILVASGVLSRLMPSLQVLFVVTPAQILVMFSVMYVVIQNIITIVIDRMVSLIS
jgi:flagellar biosynthesis protein FliR